jgi:sec-independent protein translocase protein TatC
MDERKLPFLDHLGELRLRLRNIVIALAVACTLTFWWAKALYSLLTRPLQDAWTSVLPGQTAKLGFASLVEPFWVYFELSIYAGIFVASPVIFHQLWKFIAPGLYDKEKRVAVPFGFFSAIMFIGGALFCYYLVLPAAFRFLLSYSDQNIGHIREAFGIIDVHITGPIEIAPQLFMRQYLDLTTRMLLAFGLVFEMPLFIFFLSYAGLVTHRKLWKFNKYWTILAFLIGGILTPGPDVISQLFMAAPLIVLYNLSIIIAFVITRRRERAAADEAGRTELQKP